VAIQTDSSISPSEKSKKIQVRFFMTWFMLSELLIWKKGIDDKQLAVKTKES
jgi:hypothetical protein